MKTLRLDQIGREDVAECGGKATNLGELSRLGMPVPKGFAVTASAYSEQVDAWGLSDALRPLVRGESWAAVARTAERIIGSAPFEEPLTAAVLDRYARLGRPAVAVRSSATAEDLAEASFAGQYLTVLNVEGEEALLRALRSCWASLWCKRALHYRLQRGLGQASVQMAVVVQQMAPAEVSGVMLTADPRRGSRDRMLVELGRGLGEALVSGTVSGERYEIDPQRRRVLRERRDGDGLLEASRLLELCELGRAIERHFGCPQDIEFAVSGARTFLLQARPITALAESLEPVGKASYLDAMMRPIVAERYVVAPRPLDNIVFVRLVGAVLYVARQNGAVVKAEHEAAFRARIWRQAYRLPRIRLTWRVLGAPARHVRMLERDLLAWWEADLGPALRSVSEPVELASLNDAALMERADRILAVWEDALARRFHAASAMETEPWLRALVRLAVGQRDRDGAMAALMTGLEHPTLEINRALWDLSRCARRDPQVREAVRSGSPDGLEVTPEGRVFLEQLQGFLARYGHREGACYFLSTPTWRLDPDPVWRLLSRMVDVESFPYQPERARQRYQSARDRVARGLRGWPVLPRVFGWLLERLRALHAFRETSHFDITRPLAALQEIAAEWGRRLVARGLLRRVEDVYDLSYDEVRRWLLDGAPDPAEARQMLAQRRATYALVNERWQAERGFEPSSGSEAKGVAVSPGLATGPARIVRDEGDFDRLAPGEVLVCPHTNPAWTPLFASSAAVVTETGGVASHAAIVAREYGIPAVMAVRGATVRFRDGEPIRVDGSRGVVSRLDRPPHEG